MSTDVRPAVVAALLDALAYDVTPAEFHHVIAESTRAEQAESARRLYFTAKQRAADTVTVLDLTMLQITSLASVWNILRHWDIAVLVPDKKLGDAMKVIPTDVGDLIGSALCWGGFAHPVESELV